MAQRRVRYQDVVPYDTPISLDALHRPASGPLELPITVHWSPRHIFNLDDLGQRRAGYRAIVREGTPDAQSELLNPGLLHELWPDLVLRQRCRALWETRFPTLSA